MEFIGPYGTGLHTSGTHPSFTMTAGFPRTTEKGGTSSVTKEPAAILLPRPTVIAPPITDLPERASNREGLGLKL